MDKKEEVGRVVTKVHWRKAGIESSPSLVELQPGLAVGGTSPRRCLPIFPVGTSSSGAFLWGL